MYITPAVKNNNTVTAYGRASGGMATMWKKSLTKYVSKVPTDSSRVQGTKFDLPSGALLVVNTYLPCDPRTNNMDEGPLLEVLEEIRRIISDTAAPSILITGDLNTDFSRGTRHVQIVENFFESINGVVF